MSHLLTPANLEDVIKPVTVKRSSDFSKTQKNSTKINMLLKTLQEMDDDDAANLSAFNPPPKPVSIGSTKTSSTDTSMDKPARAASSTGPGLELNSLKFNYPEPSDVETYYQKYMHPKTAGSEGYSNRQSSYPQPNQSDQAAPIASNVHYKPYTDKNLSDKINYMIHLLEDKQDVKSNSRMEEIGLYCLLGVFTIFLVDSFSRVGKYVR
jgi:hypothetical protein